MAKDLTGRCACGEIRYEISGPIEFAFQCCCRKCQRATGTGHASAFAVASDDVTMTGAAKEFAQPSDSGAQTHAGFCPNCGSPIFSRTERFPERIYIHVATLDDPSVFAPQFVVFENEAQLWDRFGPDDQSRSDS